MFPEFKDLCPSSKLNLVSDVSRDGNCFPWGPINPNPNSLFLSLAPQEGFYATQPKRARVGTLFSFNEGILEDKNPASIDVLPDEILFEIFRCLPPGEERSSSACVSRKWLMLLSTIRQNELRTKQVVPSVGKVEKEKSTESEDVEGDEYLSRFLEGKRATDIRLAAIAVGTSIKGGLRELSICGNKSTNALTNLGLKAIARSCPYLKVLSLWNVSSIGDEGLCEIANDCPLLEKLYLSWCPAITDKSLVAIAKKCPNLISITIDSCCQIGDQSLQALGNCRALSSVLLRKCPQVSDQGIAGLLSSSLSLTKLKIQSSNINDMSLVIGHYGKALTELSLCGLQNVGEKFFTINSCQGVTDVGVEALAKGCPNLKHFSIFKSGFLSDNGLVSLSKFATSLRSLKLEECHRITQWGVFGSLLNFGERLKAFSMAKCLGYKEFIVGFSMTKLCTSLKTVSINNCPGFSDVSVTILGKLCPNLENVEFNGLAGVTDKGLIPLFGKSEHALLKVVLSGCVNITDKVVSVITSLHGEVLYRLRLDGCKYLTDASLAAIAKNCSLLSELDVSKCSITDMGILALARGPLIKLQILSVANNSSISNKSLPCFIKIGQTLLGLNIRNCKGISKSTVDVLTKRLYECDILN